MRNASIHCDHQCKAGLRKQRDAEINNEERSNKGGGTGGGWRYPHGGVKKRGKNRVIAIPGGRKDRRAVWPAAG